MNFFGPGIEMSYLDKLKSTTELLDYYDAKYAVDEYTNNSDNILIDIKK